MRPIRKARYGSKIFSVEGLADSFPLRNFNCGRCGLSLANPRSLFCPARPRYEGTAERAELENFTRALFQITRAGSNALFLARRPEDFDCGATPGSGTFYGVEYPEQELTAIASAARALTFELDVAFAAKALGTPTLFVARDADEVRTCETWGIGTISLRTCEHAREIYRRFEALGPKETISDPVPGSVQSGTAAISVALITDKNYLPFLVGFLENLAVRSSPETLVYVLCLDAESETFLARYRAPRPICVVSPQEIYSPDELARLSNRSIADRAYAAKPRLLSFALRTCAGPVFYSDLDLYFFECVGALENEFCDGDVLLFPQWNDLLRSSRFFGAFNAGLVGVRRGAERFLQWWSDLCLYEYCRDAREGYFVDQGFLDLAHLYFENVRVYRKADHNVANWNLASLRESVSGEKIRLRHGRPIRSFHAAVPDTEGLYEEKFLWDQLAYFFSAVPRKFGDALEQNVLRQQADHWLALSRWIFFPVALRTLLPGSVQNFFLGKPGRRVLAVMAWFHFRWRTCRDWFNAPEETLGTDAWRDFQKGFFESQFGMTPDSQPKALADPDFGRKSFRFRHATRSPDDRPPQVTH